MEGFRDYLPVWALPREIKNENHEFASSTISRIPLSSSSVNSANICSTVCLNGTHALAHPAIAE